MQASLGGDFLHGKENSKDSNAFGESPDSQQSASGIYNPGDEEYDPTRQPSPKINYDTLNSGAAEST